jgi:hypothetical protein
MRTFLNFHLTPKYLLELSLTTTSINCITPPNSQSVSWLSVDSSITKRERSRLFRIEKCRNLRGVFCFGLFWFYWSLNSNLRTCYAVRTKPPACSGYFRDKVSLFAWVSLDSYPLYLGLQALTTVPSSEMGSHKPFAWAGFESQSSWS